MLAVEGDDVIQRADVVRVLGERGEVVADVVVEVCLDDRELGFGGRAGVVPLLLYLHQKVDIPRDGNVSVHKGGDRVGESSPVPLVWCYYLLAARDVRILRDQRTGFLDRVDYPHQRLVLVFLQLGLRRRLPQSVLRHPEPRVTERRPICQKGLKWGGLNKPLTRLTGDIVICRGLGRRESETYWETPLVSTLRWQT